MLFQILVGQVNAPYGNYPTALINVPFIGKCRVKIIKIDYFFNTAGSILQRIVAINSQVFNTNSLLTPSNTPNIQVIPSMGRILFYNTTNPYYGNNFVIDDLMINGVFDITLSDETGAALPTPATNGGYTNLLLTLDIEYMGKVKLI